MLYDSSKEYFLAVRSASGRVPLYWGPDKHQGDNLLLSTEAGHLGPFPAGLAFEVTFKHPALGLLSPCGALFPSLSVICCQQDRLGLTGKGVSLDRKKARLLCVRTATSSTSMAMRESGSVCVGKLANC